jgi:hypothetical protein
VVEEAEIPREDPLTPEGQMRRLKLNFADLPPFVKRLAERKVGRMLDMMRANKQLEEKVADLEKLSKAKDVFETATPIQMKLFYADQSVARVRMIDSSFGIAKLQEIVARILGKPNVVLWVRIGKERRNLNDDTLKQAHLMIRLGRSPTLVLYATPE